jgi:DNA polymerase-3 subunit alpha
MIQLHAHSIYSQLDGLLKPNDLAEIGKEDGAIALTDHGTVSGHIAFYKACKAAGVKPILGVEAYYNYDGKRHHMTILAQNTEGYKSLLRIQTEGAKLNNKFNIINLNTLEQYSENLIITTGCSTGYATQLANNSKDLNEVCLFLEGWQNKFKNFYIEFQPNEGYIEAYHLLYMAACKLGIPHITTCDIHYAKKEDYVLYKDIHLIMTGKQSDLELTWLYPWSAQAMSSFFIKNGFPNNFVQTAIENINGIANKCNVDIDCSKKWSFEEDLDKTWQFCYEKILSLYPKLDSTMQYEYVKRLSYEFKTFEELGLIGYLEFCQDILNFCRDNDIPYGPGRGSCVGSLVCYLMGITEVDPIANKLSFERFLSPNYRIGLLNGS